MARGARWTFVSAWGERILAVVVFAVLTRTLTPTDFGIVAVAMAVVFLLNIIQDAGLPVAIVQREDLTSAHVSSALTANVVLGVVGATIVFSSADALASVLGEPTASPVLRTLALNLPIAGLAAVPMSLLMRAMAFRSLALRTLTGKVAGGLLAVTIALAGGGAWALVAQSLTQGVVSLVILWLALDVRPRFGFDRRALRDLMSFGSFELGIRLLVTTTERADDLILGAVRGSTSLGFYTVAYKVLELLTQLFGKVFSRVTMPVLSRLQEDPRGHRDAVVDILGVTIALATPAFVGWALVADPAIEVLFGARWTPSVPVSQALAFVGLHRVLIANTHTAVSSIGRPRAVFMLQVVITTAAVAAFAATAGIGITTLAIAYAGVVWLTVPLEFVLLRRAVGIRGRDIARRVRGPVVGAIAMALAVGGVRTALVTSETITGGLGLLIVLIAVGAATYTAALRLVDRAVYRHVVLVVRQAAGSGSTRDSGTTEKGASRPTREGTAPR